MVNMIGVYSKKAQMCPYLLKRIMQNINIPNSHCQSVVALIDLRRPWFIL